MNYIREVNAFYNELEINPLSSSAIALWFALLHIKSRSGSKDKFSVPVGTLSLKSGLSHRSVSNARNELKTKGYIEFHSRGGNRAAIYQLRMLSANNARTVSDKTSDKTSDNVSTLINISSSASSTANGYESFYAAHKRVFGFDCNPWQANKLAAYIDQDGMEEAVVIRAIERAGTAAVGYNFNLITKILDDYFRAQAFTLDRAIAIDDQFSAKRNRSNSRQVSRGSFTEMARRMGG